MGSVINYTNIESKAYSNIFEIVDDRTKIVDPKRKSMTNASVQKRMFVYDSDPFEKSINFDDLPYIILELPVISDSPESHSVDSTKSNISWTQKIVVRTKRESSSKVDVDRGRTDILDICDDLFQTFNSRTVKDSLYGFNMKHLTISKVRQDVYAMNTNDIYEAEFELKFSSRLAVSA